MKKATLFILSISLLFLSSCGYTLSRTGGADGRAPSRKAAVPIFVNETFEPLVEKDITAALQEELLMDGRWALVDAGEAELLVSGRVTGFDLVPLTYDPEERILEYRVKVRADIKVTDVKADRTLFKEPIETHADYRVTEDVTKSKVRRQEAIRKAGKNMAEEFIIKVLDTF